MIIQKSLSEKKKFEIKNCLFTDVTLANSNCAKFEGKRTNYF